MNRTFSYVSDTTSRTQRLAPKEFDRHEYWGKDFAKGECEVAIFRSDKGTLIAVWTYGCWSEFDGIEAGRCYTFEHTQTRRHKTMELVAIVHKDTAVPFAAKRMRQWTLK